VKPAATATAAAVFIAGALAAALSFPREVRVASDGDWRAVTQGLRRSGTPGALAASGDALVHFHDVRGGIESVELAAAARAAGTLAVARDGSDLFAAPLDAAPRRLVVPGVSGVSGRRDIDIGLRTAGSIAETSTAAAGSTGGRLLLYEIRLRRGPSAAALRVLPLLCGVGVLFLLRRKPPVLSALVAIGAVAVTAAALATAFDPVSLLPLRPGTRAATQAVAAALAAALGVAHADCRRVRVLAVLGVVVVLYAPALRGGLVYDDFLWTRPWSLGEVASTFVGSEDPTGVSNSYYRPLASTSHALDYALWGFRPAVYHLTNLAMMTAAGLLALSLFRRFPVSPGAAAAGALVWIAHPMSASAVAWLSQRTDLILAVFYLAALRALVARPFGRRQAAAVVGLGLLTFAAKELALTLPLAAALLVFALPRGEDPDRGRRWAVVRGLGGMAAAYVAFWIALFPEKLMTRTGTARGWGGFDPQAASDWLRLLPALFGPIVLPTGYAEWWRTRLEDWSLVYCAAVVGLTVFVLGASAWNASRALRRVAVVAAVWPIVVLLPLLGLRGIDLYRGGLMVALAAGWMAVAATERLNGWNPRLCACAAAALVFVLTPRTAATVAAWGSGGFYRTMTQASIRDMPTWLARLQPHCRDAFWAQVRHDEHMAPDE
jgi:hypothetical protein